METNAEVLAQLEKMRSNQREGFDLILTAMLRIIPRDVGDENYTKLIKRITRFVAHLPRN